jgi:cell division protein FtsN
MTAPAGARPAAQSRLQIKPVAAEPKRSVSTVTKDDSWLLAGAFADQGSAERLAASIERQGYPAKVRRHDATATPWVVWIGKQPRGMTPSERK